MSRHFTFSLLAAGLLLSGSAMGGDDEGAVTVYFTVLKEYNGKPVRNASVILHPVDKKGKQSPHGPQLKTGPDGRTYYPGVPFGKMRVQVIAPGFQTFGEDYVIGKDTKEIEIKLKRPQEQFSIYDKSEGRKGTMPEPKKDAPKDPK